MGLRCTLKVADINRAHIFGLSAGAMAVDVDIGKDLGIWTTRRDHTLITRIGLASEVLIGIVAISVHDDPRHVRRTRRHAYQFRNVLGAAPYN